MNGRVADMWTVIGVVVVLALFVVFPATVLMAALGLWIGGVVGAVVAGVIGLVMDANMG